MTVRIAIATMPEVCCETAYQSNEEHRQPLTSGCAGGRDGRGQDAVAVGVEGRDRDERGGLSMNMVDNITTRITKDEDGLHARPRRSHPGGDR